MTQLKYALITGLLFLSAFSAAETLAQEAGRVGNSSYEGHELGNEELLIIKAVSTEGKTFIVGKGYADGLGEHQTSLFSNDKVSIKARVIEISRFSSLWKVEEENLILPFKKGDFVSFQRDTEKIWTETQRTHAKIEQFQERQDRYRWQRQSYWMSRFSFSRALSDSVSETRAQPTTRTGLQGEVLYQIPLNQHFDFGYGARLDQETLVQESPSLEIPTNRYLAIAEITYNFDNFAGREDFVYLSAGMGYGISQTEVNERVNSGTAMVFPLRLGYANPLSQDKAFVAEIVTESVSATETVEGANREQQTTIVNAKASIGLRF